MGNIHILYSPPTDTGAYSGGSWLANLPLANLKNQQPTKLARSADLNPDNTRFVIDFGVQKRVSMLALIAHNLTGDALVRFRASNNADGSDPLIDVTVDAIASNVVWGAYPWGNFPWDGYIADDFPVGPTTFYSTSQPVGARYVLVDIADPTNLKGYVQAGRFMAGEPFAPSINMSLGTQLSFIDESRQSRSVGGQLYSDVKPRRRRLACSLDWLSQGEALGTAYDLLRNIGITGNVLAVYDPDDDGSVILRRTIYGHITDLSPIVEATPTDKPYSWQFAVEELI